MNYLEQEWRIQDADLVEAGAPDTQRDSMRQAFYIGARAVAIAIMKTDPMSGDETIAFMGGIFDEVREFEEAHKLRALLNTLTIARQKGMKS